MNAPASDLAVLIRRWPADWYSRYDRPVARILSVHSGRAVVASQTYATQGYAEAYPVRWPQLVGQPLPPVPPVAPLARSTAVMGAPAQADDAPSR